ncbi:hypothetical protein CWI36_0342p0050, partial [Hamiltosporidium magnivora]
MITLTELRITSQDSLQIVKIEKLRKYNFLANRLGLIYKCSVEIIPNMMTWDGIVTKYYKTYVKRLRIVMNIEAYIQFIVIGMQSKPLTLINIEDLCQGLSRKELYKASLS